MDDRFGDRGWVAVMRLKMKPIKLWSPLRLTLVYLVVAGLWLLLFDSLRIACDSSIPRLFNWIAVPDLGFLLVTGTLLFFERQRVNKYISYQSQLLEAVPDAVICTDMDFNINFLNRAATKLYGWPMAEALGKSVGEIIPTQYIDDDGPAAVQQLFRQQSWQGEVLQQCRDGQPVDILASVSLIKDQRERPIGVVAVNRDITEYKQARQQLARRVTEQATLLEISRLFLEQGSETSKLQSICNLLVEQFNLKMARVGFVSRDDFVVRPVASAGVPEDFLRALTTTWDDSPAGQGPSGRAIKTENIVVINSIDDAAPPLPWREQAIRHGIHAVVSLPLVDQAEILGVLNAYSTEAGFFSRERVQLLQLAANFIAVVLTRTRSFQQAQQRLEQLAAIHRASQQLQYLEKPERLAKNIIAIMEEMIEFEYGAVLLLDEAASRLVPFAVSTPGQGNLLAAEEREHILPDHPGAKAGITGWVARYGQSVCSGNVKTDPRYFGMRGNINSELCVPLFAADKVIGVVNVETSRPMAYTPDHQYLLETIAAQISVAVQNSRLFSEVQNGNLRLKTLSNKLVVAQETERRYLARELHDEIGQVLTAVKINLQTIQRLPPDGAIGSTLEESIEIVGQALQQVRDLSLDLRPSLLDDLGLIATLRWYLARQSQRAGFQVTFSAEPEEFRLPAELETVCFRVVQEAVNNVARHASAKTVEVMVVRKPGHLQLCVCDDGIGFDVKAVLDAAARGGSLGMLSMQERVYLLEGRLDIRSNPGFGTQINIEFPLTGGET